MKKHLLMMAALTLLLTACHKDKTPATDLQLTVNGEEYTLPLAADTVVDLTTLCTEFDAEITVKNAAEFQELSLDGQSLAGGSCLYNVGTIAADHQMTLRYRSGDKEGVLRLNTLHSGIPQMETTGRAETDGDFYLSFVYQRLIMKYDNEGNVLYYRFEPHQPQNSVDVTGWWDFKKHEVNGITYYSYHAPDPAFSHLVINGYNPGKRVIMDEHYRVVKTLQLEAAGPYVHKGDPIDGHDFVLFDLDHYIMSSYIDRQIGDSTVASAYLQEVQNGQVVFDWWSVDHPEMEAMFDLVFSGSAGKDYVHFNAIQVLPDGNWLCSFRHLSTLLKIARANGSGDILWRIDGRAQTDACSFSGQHCARLHGSTLTLFDNGNGHTPQITRAQRLTIDPATGEILGGGNTVISDYFSQACGAVTLIGDHVVVGWGMPGANASAEKGSRVVTEHDASGNEIFGIRNTGSVAQNLLLCSYRCVKQ